MSKAITKPKLEDVVANAVRDLPPAATPTDVATRVTGDPAIAPALEPISRFESQTLRGVVIAAGAPLLVALGRTVGAPIAESAAAELVATLVSLAGAAYAWYGRETTTRPLK